MKIEINKLTLEKVEVGFLKRIAEKVLSLDKLGMKISKKFSELSVAVVGDKEMIKLNKQHRKQNKTTDVLAFDYGEIIICLNQAKRQAKELKHSLKKELGILLIHGILHLSGYDDETKKQRDEMMKKQDKILIKLKNSPR